MNAGEFLGWILIALGVMLGFLLGGCILGDPKELMIISSIVAGIPIFFGYLLIKMS